MDNLEALAKDFDLHDIKDLDKLDYQSLLPLLFGQLENLNEIIEFELEHYKNLVQEEKRLLDWIEEEKKIATYLKKSSESYVNRRLLNYVKKKKMIISYVEKNIKEDDNEEMLLDSIEKEKLIVRNIEKYIQDNISVQELMVSIEKNKTEGSDVEYLEKIINYQKWYNDLTLKNESAESVEEETAEVDLRPEQCCSDFTSKNEGAVSLEEDISEIDSKSEQSFNFMKEKLNLELHLIHMELQELLLKFCRKYCPRNPVDDEFICSFFNLKQKKKKTLYEVMKELISHLNANEEEIIIEDVLPDRVVNMLLHADVIKISEKGHLVIK